MSMACADDRPVIGEYKLCHVMNVRLDDMLARLWVVWVLKIIRLCV